MGSESNPAKVEQTSAADPGKAASGIQAPSFTAPADATGGAEQELWIGRTSWKHFTGRITFWLVVNIVAATLLISNRPLGNALQWTLIVFGVMTLVVFGSILWSVLSQRLKVTSQRLIIERGILSQTIDQLELMRVDDLRIHKSLMDRLLGLGTIEIISTTDATHPEIRMVGIESPDDVGELVRARMRAMRQRAMFIENV